MTSSNFHAYVSQNWLKAPAGKDTHEEEDGFETLMLYCMPSCPVAAVLASVKGLLPVCMVYMKPNAMLAGSTTCRAAHMAALLTCARRL